MTINHLIAKDYFFVNSFKDTKDNIILNTWDDIKNSGEDYPTNNVLFETLQPITILNNKIEETLTMEEIVESELTTSHKSYSINKRLFPISLNVNNVYYFVDIKGKFNLLYLNEDKLFSLNPSFKISDKEKEFSINEDNKLILKISSKQSIELTSIIDSEYIIENNDIILLKGLDLNSLDFNLEDNEDENIVADYFAIDTFNNIYVVLNGKYNVIENSKLKKTTEKSIESIVYYIDEEDSKNLLSEYTFESGVNSFEKLTLQDLERFLWSIADVIRDKSKLNANDYINVSVPLMLLKRVLDTREEYINDVVLKSQTYQNNLLNVCSNEQEALIKSINTKIKSDGIEVFEIVEDKESWYGATWQDIIEFTNNPLGEEREIQFKRFNLKVKSKSKNVQEFMEEIIDSLNPKLHKLYEFTNFTNLIKSNDKFPKVELIKILNDFNRYSLNYRNANEDIFSNAYMYLISKFASGSGKKGGEFFTPSKLTQDLIPFLDIQLPENGSITIADPTAGSGSFVVEVFNYLQRKNLLSLSDINDKTTIVIQELEEITYLFAEVNLLLRGVTNYSVFHNNTITEYNENTIGQYKNLVDYIVANPPYGLKDYGYEYAIDSGEDRWEFGVPNKGDGDYAFLLTINDLLTNVGKAGVILPLGTLFKDTTKKIRENFLNKDFIEGIIILPGNMFQTTSIPVCFWIINKDKKEEDKGKIFMVNGSNEFIKEGKFNVFQPERCLHNYLNRLEEEGLSGYINIKDIIDENDSNLSVQRYVFKDEPEEVIDIVELNKDIINLNNDIITKSNDMNFILSQILKLQ